jgi:hypothetical protein
VPDTKLNEGPAALGRPLGEQEKATPQRLGEIGPGQGKLCALDNRLLMGGTFTGTFMSFREHNMPRRTGLAR